MIRALIAAAALTLVVAVGAIGFAPAASSKEAPAKASFRVMDVYVDSKASVAAYQLEVVVARGSSLVVGVEGGEKPLHTAPYYDHAAFAKGRIIIAAFTTRGALTPGRHRVATLHVREGAAGADYKVSLRLVADKEGVKQAGSATIEPRKKTRSER